MEHAPPTLLRIAREFLGLSQDEVEAVFGMSRKTIQRVERGEAVVKHYVFSLQHFYEANGIEFVPPSGAKGWGVFNVNTKDDPTCLNTLGDIPPSRRKKAPEAAK
ncbi:XRE family transcriptional regulator [Rhizobium ruizarguesonis]|uniref:helix-turn-helix domain-containing protein n=1 Tax=Rhizobium TaxID=379 RepID=UPI00102F720F|nr:MULTISPECIES: helix-turn-helix transcriptional regulator [Rhizobium]TAW53291.1 XRE family transcriptional regulator [Rhizobium leguminosarum]TAW66019.1 XRE family transcriptional regulator [Rhizobium ruizarguesonis]